MTNNHAVVIGGSIAGLVVARILSDRFKQVTLIERDQFPEEAIPRKGTPQSRHIHVLLLQGQIILEKLFPGLRDEMIAAGAQVMDVAADWIWLNPAGWGVRFPSDLFILSFSRDLLDWKVRCRLAAINNIRFLQRCEVTGVLSNTDSTCVAGVSVRHHQQSHQGVCEEEQLDADLVVDATGRTSKAPQWLKAIGYQPPQETVLNSFLGYASRLYRLPSDFQADWKGVYLQVAPPSRTRGAGLLPLEENRWILTAYGGDRDYPPTDEAGFLEFVRSLPYPAIYDAIKDAEPLSQIYSYRATENRWRHYEQLPRYLEGFLVVGDAACAFNPVYGQGMTTAALGALTLDKCLQQQQQYQLDRGFTGLARRFQKKLAKINAVPWLLATSEDYRYQGTEGQPPSLLTRLMHRYMDEVVQLTTNNAEVRLALLEVMHMLKPPITLFQAKIVIQVLKRLFKLSSVFPARTSHSQQIG